MKQIFNILFVCLALFLSGCSGCSRSGRRKVVHPKDTLAVNDSAQKSLDTAKVKKKVE